MDSRQPANKFLMQVQPKEEYVEDPTPYPAVPGAVFTTGKGGQLQPSERSAGNGELGAALNQMDSDASEESHHHQRTVGVAVAAVMLVAEMAGSGVLALPRALANTGWGGVVLLLALGIGVGVSGSRLGLAWVMLENNFPKYKGACRTPYPAIGYEALGRPGRLVVIIAQNLTLIGVTTVFLILSGDMLQALLGDLVPVVFSSHCYCTLLVGAALIPLSWLGTPKDFWPTAIVAMSTTVIAVVVVVVQLIIEAPTIEAESNGSATFRSFFLGFGTILFSFGGAATFPTIQNDMKDRSKFPYSVAIAFLESSDLTRISLSCDLFIKLSSMELNGAQWSSMDVQNAAIKALVLLLMYIPISTVGYGVVGNEVPGNILRAVSGYVVQVTQGLVVLHLLTAYVILINPVTQGLEEAFNLPRKFSWKRSLLRTLLVLFEVAVGLAIPDFAKILDLVGASTVTLMSFVLPPICYLRLADTIDERGEAFGAVPYYERVILYIVLLAGLMGGVIATWSAIASISTPSNGPAGCFF
ncbi:Amino acid transporter transmembrane domain [Trinorchestia longiramus]|nr:Amino acid transporter transmembrane domain [Trinorchestia longiramus]